MQKLLNQHKNSLSKTPSENYVSTEFMHAYPAIKKKINPISIILFCCYGLGCFYFGAKLFREEIKKQNIINQHHLSEMISEKIDHHYNAFYKKQDLLNLKEEIKKEILLSQNSQKEVIIKYVEQTNDKEHKKEITKTPETITYSAESYNYLRGLQELEIEQLIKKKNEEIKSYSSKEGRFSSEAIQEIQKIEHKYKKLLLGLKYEHEMAKSKLRKEKVIVLR